MSHLSALVSRPELFPGLTRLTPAPTPSGLDTFRASCGDDHLRPLFCNSLYPGLRTAGPSDLALARHFFPSSFSASDTG